MSVLIYKTGYFF